MADLKQAMIWLAEGKRVTRKEWRSTVYLYLENGQIRAHDGNVYLPNVDDWELYREDATKKCAELTKKIDAQSDRIEKLEVQLQAVNETISKIRSRSGWLFG